MGANPRSTVGTVTDVNAMLRILFSRIATPSLGGPRAYSFIVASASGRAPSEADGTREVRQFTVTGGMCVRCEGRGSVSDFGLDQLFDKAKSLAEGALTVPGMTMDGWYGRIFACSKFFDMDKPIKDYSKRELDNLLHKEPTKINVDGVNLTYEGVIPRVQRSMLSKDAATKILDRLHDVGLGYLRIGQPLTTLSGGERQRLKLATHMGDKGGTYILDEPTTVLYLADVRTLLELLDALVDAGKNVVVIEHHQAVMAHADWIIDLPGAGHDGGRVVFEGTPADLVAAPSTRTGQHLASYVGARTAGGDDVRAARSRRERERG